MDPAKAESEARALVADLLVQRPAHNEYHTGTLNIRDPDGKERVIPFWCKLMATPTNWMSVYATTPSNGPAPTRLTVIHTEAAPNQYLLSDLGSESASHGASSPTRMQPLPGPQAEDPPCRELTGAQAMVPFAGSDFWLADLGLEFLHWPSQRLLKKELRKSQSCDVLESINPKQTNGYIRVVSWITIESGGIVHADAYDARNELIKQFDPKKLEKVHGQYELQEMEIRNLKTRSRTRIDFDLDPP